MTIPNVLSKGPISGLANCHLRGIYSLVFRERLDDQNGMVRVFYVPDIDSLQEVYTYPDFTVMPHNHRQALNLTLLCGEATNVIFDLNDYAYPQTMVEYVFDSALLNGSFSLKRTGRQFFGEVIKIPLSDIPVKMAPFEVHTVQAQKGSAWLVQEGQVSTSEPLCYSLLYDKKLDSTGLYTPLDPDELGDIWWELRKRIEKQPCLTYQ